MENRTLTYIFFIDDDILITIGALMFVPKPEGVHGLMLDEVVP